MSIGDFEKIQQIPGNLAAHMYVNKRLEVLSHSDWLENEG